jgi:hypothetical protein
VDVSGVARDEDPPELEVVGVPGVHPEDALPHGLGEADALGSLLADEPLHLLGAHPLAGGEAREETEDAVRQGHDDQRALGRLVVQRLVGGQFALDAGVHQREGALVGESAETGPHQGADGAARPVGADDEPGAGAFDAAVGVLQYGRDAVDGVDAAGEVEVVEGEQAYTALHGAAELAKDAAQHPFRLALRRAERDQRAGEVERGEVLAVGEVAEGVDVQARRAQLVQGAEVLEEVQAPGPHQQGLGKG